MLIIWILDAIGHHVKGCLDCYHGDDCKLAFVMKHTESRSCDLSASRK